MPSSIPNSLKQLNSPYLGIQYKFSSTYTLHHSDSIFLYKVKYLIMTLLRRDKTDSGR